MKSKLKAEGANAQRRNFDAADPLRDLITILIMIRRDRAVLFPDSAPGSATDTAFQLADALRGHRNGVAHTVRLSLVQAESFLARAVALLGLVAQASSHASEDDLARRANRASADLGDRLGALRHQRDRFPFAIPLSDTLFVAPCSAHKVPRAVEHENGCSVLADLRAAATDKAREAADRLEQARSERKVWARVDPSSGLLRAFRRYGEGHGTFWRGGAGALQEAVVGGHIRLVLLSGGYGLVRADEPIHWYDGDMNLCPFAKGFIADMVLAYAEACEARRIVGLARSGSEYWRALDQARKRGRNTEVTLIEPVSFRRGRPHSDGVLGEALAALLAPGGIPQGWTSSEGATVRLHPQ